MSLGAGAVVDAVSGLFCSTCVLLRSRDVKCWGMNLHGQLGLGDLNVRGSGPNQKGASLLPLDFGPGRYATAISVGAYHACAILDNGGLKCWGYNSDGQLGIGPSTTLAGT